MFWRCGCGFRNWVTRFHCDKCGKERPRAPVARLVLVLWYLLIPTTALAHDWKHPDLDQWYSGLMRPHGHSWSGGGSCCSKTDCHTTEAEIRNGKWWARLGVPKEHDDWDLRDWVEVPDELIVRGPNGNPVANQAGEAVICHSWSMTGHQLFPAASTIYCFVPPNQT